MGTHRQGRIKSVCDRAQYESTLTLMVLTDDNNNVIAIYFGPHNEQAQLEFKYTGDAEIQRLSQTAFYYIKLIIYIFIRQ